MLKPSKVQKHLSRLPGYLVPKDAAQVDLTAHKPPRDNRKRNAKRREKARAKAAAAAAAGGGKPGSDDPLKSFEFKGAAGACSVHCALCSAPCAPA